MQMRCVYLVGIKTDENQLHHFVMYSWFESKSNVTH